MKNYRDIEVSGKKFKNGKSFAWAYSFSIDGSIIGTKIFSMKQNRLDMIAFNFCVENGLNSLIHISCI